MDEKLFLFVTSPCWIPVFILESKCVFMLVKYIFNFKFSYCHFILLHLYKLSAFFKGAQTFCNTWKPWEPSSVIASAWCYPCALLLVNCHIGHASGHFFLLLSSFELFITYCTGYLSVYMQRSTAGEHGKFRQRMQSSKICKVSISNLIP